MEISKQIITLNNSKIVSSDEQKRNSRQKMLKIVGSGRNWQYCLIIARRCLSLQGRYGI